MDRSLPRILNLFRILVQCRKFECLKFENRELPPDEVIPITADHPQVLVFWIRIGRNSPFQGAVQVKPGSSGGSPWKRCTQFPPAAG